MTTIGRYTSQDFVGNFPVNLGSGMRGSWIENGKKEMIGILVAHRLPSGEVCAGTVFWQFQHIKRPVWTLISKEPLTLAQSIKCTCGVHGHIKEGKWVDAADSTLLR